MPKANRKNSRKKTKYAKKMRINFKAIAIMITVIVLTFLGVLYFNMERNSSEEPPIVGGEVDPRCLVSNPNQLQKDICSALENALDDQSRAEFTATSFAVDYFTWNNKRSRNDVGGRYYIMEDIRSSFVNFHIYGYYRSFLENANTYRIQNLPEVSSYTIMNSRKGYFDFGDLGINVPEEDIFEVTIGVTYKPNSSGMATADLPVNMVVTVYKYNDAFYVAKAE